MHTRRIWCTRPVAQYPQAVLVDGKLPLCVDHDLSAFSTTAFLAVSELAWRHLACRRLCISRVRNLCPKPGCERVFGGCARASAPVVWIASVAAARSRLQRRGRQGFRPRSDGPLSFYEPFNLSCAAGSSGNLLRASLAFASARAFPMRSNSEIFTPMSAAVVWVGP